MSSYDTCRLQKPLALRAKKFLPPAKTDLLRTFLPDVILVPPGRLRCFAGPMRSPGPAIFSMRLVRLRIVGNFGGGFSFLNIQVGHLRSIRVETQATGRLLQQLLVRHGVIPLAPGAPPSTEIVFAAFVGHNIQHPLAQPATRLAMSARLFSRTQASGDA